MFDFEPVLKISNKFLSKIDSVKDTKTREFFVHRSCNRDDRVDDKQIYNLLLSENETKF